MALADVRTDFAQRLSGAWRSPLVLSVAALWLFLVAAETARPCFFLHDDNATWFIAAYVQDFRVLTETGRVAEVNYDQYGGEPFLEQGQTAVLYPPIYLGVATAKWISGDLRWSIEWIAAEHLTLGLLGFYFWLKRAGVSAPYAAVGALAWVLNPFVLIVGSSWITVTFLACYLPWLFWAIDRLWGRPSYLSAFFLGTILALFFLQGYVQWVVYSLLFLGIYALFRLLERNEIDRPAILYQLAVAVLIFLMWSAPLLLPMLHATQFSAERAKPLLLAHALEFRVVGVDLLRAQFGWFRPHLIYGVSTAILYCPALLLLPLMILRFVQTYPTIRQRLFPLLFLAMLALLFSSRWHLFLTWTPLFERFRWPFKVFVFADFFLIAALVWSLTPDALSPIRSNRRWNLAAWVCLVLVLFGGATVSLANHDSSMLSKTGLPTSRNPLPPGIDPQLGRVVAIDNILPEAASYRLLTHCYGTFFAVPSIGGYDPLASADALRFGLGLEFPNVLYARVTPDLRQSLNDRAVRYWLVDPQSPRLQEIESLPGLKLLDAAPDRVIFENTQAAPLAYSASNPTTACALTYAGNSILIPIGSANSPLEISVGPTDGWWYRIDGGRWQKPVYRDNRLALSYVSPARLVEISYFDARFERGLALSACLFFVVGLLLAIHLISRKRWPAG